MDPRITVATLALIAGCDAAMKSAPAPADAGPRDAAALDLGFPEDATTAADAQTPDAAPSDAGSPGPNLDGFLAQVARATCGALARCCDNASIERYFAPIVANPNLMPRFAARLPPSASFDAASCPALLEEVFTAQPFGAWVAEARAGNVEYDPAAYAACLATLEGAACGAPVAAALVDGTCLGFSPPLGGADRRRMFRRVKQAGAPCRTLTDGAGGRFYGTCDPDVAFCCFPGADPGQCVVRAEGEGQCRRTSQAGEACSSFPNLQLCSTGLDCDPSDNRCRAPGAAPLALGALCWDDVRFAELGQCTTGWCDIFDSLRCEAPKADGAACRAGYECASGGCEGSVCGPSRFCTGR